MWASWAALLIVLAVPAAVLLLAVWALVAGWRGRRVGTEPVCARCNYVLIGLPETSSRCPECGSDLTARRAIVQGQRQRLRWALAVSGVVLAGFAMLIGFGVRHVWLNVNLAPYKPTAWLVEDLASVDARLRTAALTEFRHRTSPTVQNPDRLRAAADRVLQWQADKTKPWFVEQGDFIERLRVVGTLDTDRYLQYLRTGTDFSVEVRKRYRIGDPFPFQLSPTPRMGSGNRVVGWVIARLQWPVPGGDPVDLSQSSGTLGVVLNSSHGRFYTTITPQPDAFTGRPLGSQDLLVELNVSVYEVSAGSGWPGEKDYPVLDLRFVRPFRVELLPAGTEHIRMIQREGLAEEVRSAISKPDVRFRWTDTRAYADVRLSINSVPEDVGLTCILVLDGVETPIGSIAARRGERGTWGLGSEVKFANGKDRPPDRVSLILRADRNVALRSVHLEQIADIELRWDDLQTFYTPATTTQYYSPP